MALCQRNSTHLQEPRRYVFTQTVSVSAELRQPAYMTVPAKAIGYNQVPGLMEKVRWDVHEIMSQHSYYVDVLVRVSSPRGRCHDCRFGAY